MHCIVQYWSTRNFTAVSPTRAQWKTSDDVQGYNTVFFTNGSWVVAQLSSFPRYATVLETEVPVKVEGLSNEAWPMPQACIIILTDSHAQGQHPPDWWGNEDTSWTVWAFASIVLPTVFTLLGARAIKTAHYSSIQIRDEVTTYYYQPAGHVWA